MVRSEAFLSAVRNFPGAGVFSKLLSAVLTINVGLIAYVYPRVDSRDGSRVGASDFGGQVIPSLAARGGANHENGNFAALASASNFSMQHHHANCLVAAHRFALKR